MIRLTLGLALVALALPVPSRAAIPKCGDAPFRDGSGQLWITWVVPIPAGARVRPLRRGEFPPTAWKATEPVYAALLARIEKKHLLAKQPPALESCAAVPTGVTHRTSSPRDLRRWEWREFEIDSEARATPLLEAYAAELWDFYAVAIGHPPLACEAGATGEKARAWARCEPERLALDHTTPFHTHVVVLLGGRTVTAFLRSVVLSRDASGSRQHCLVNDGLRVEFPARRDGKLKLPMRFAALLDGEEYSLVVDLLSSEALPGTAPPGARVEKIDAEELRALKRSHGVRLVWEGPVKAEDLLLPITVGK